MIRFDNWTIQADGEILARQFDNKTRTLTVAGDIPVGWEWVVLVKVGNAMDIIPLAATEGALSAVLTAQQLSISGYYQMQLRATKGDNVRHTNIVSVYIPDSLSGDEQWPEIPSEFTEMEKRINEKVNELEGKRIQSVAFDHTIGRYVITLKDGTSVSVDGYDPTNSIIWSFVREGFER